MFIKNSVHSVESKEANDDDYRKKMGQNERRSKCTSLYKLSALSGLE